MYHGICQLLLACAAAAATVTPPAGFDVACLQLSVLALSLSRTQHLLLEGGDR
jgi:hypothetical protein